MTNLWKRLFRSRRLQSRLLIPCAALFSLAPMVTRAQERNSPSPIPVEKPHLATDEIVSRLQERSQAREMALQKLQGTRVYRLHYRGFLGVRSAEAVVSYTYTAPDHKELSIVSETGSKFLIDHVIKGLLEAEKESATAENHQRTALTTNNYTFVPADGRSGEGSDYALNVYPKTDCKFLYRGEIWIDPRDFAVTRIEAEPAKNPSFWLRQSKVYQQYKKVGDFWLPAENRTESSIRMGGRAVLSIEYRNYDFIEATPLEPTALLSSTSGAQ